MYKTENKHIICNFFIGNLTLHRHPRVNVLTSPPPGLSNTLYCMPILCRHRDLSPVVFDARTHGRFHRSRLNTREFETRRASRRRTRRVQRRVASYQDASATPPHAKHHAGTSTRTRANATHRSTNALERSRRAGETSTPMDDRPSPRNLSLSRRHRRGVERRSARSGSVR